jgi:hypothetical protein
MKHRKLKGESYRLLVNPWRLSTTSQDEAIAKNIEVDRRPAKGGKAEIPSAQEDVKNSMAEV